MDKIKALGIIPARWESSRFPGKPLAMIGERTMIEHVYRAATRTLDMVVVATDDERIAAAVKDFGGKAVMTSRDCPNGTARCYEAYCSLGVEADVVVNIQGDEPFISPEEISLVAAGKEQITTLIRPIGEADKDSIHDPNTVKAVVDHECYAMYFSRQAIPYVRGVDSEQWHRYCQYFAHVGIYGFQPDALAAIAKAEPTELALAEGLEQLSWLQRGMRILCEFTDRVTIGIDTPTDLERARDKYMRMHAPAIHSLGAMTLPEPRRYTLPNGIRMVVLGDGTDEVTRLTVVRDGGAGDTPDSFMPRLAAQLLREGTAEISSAEVAELLDYNGATFAGTAHLHHSSATLMALNERFDAVLPTFIKLLQNPHFPDHEVAVVAEQMARQLEMEREKVMYNADLEAERQVKGQGHPLLMNYTPDDIRAVTPEALRRYYADSFATDRITAYVAGCVTPEAESQIARALSELRSTGGGIKPVIISFAPMPAERHDIEQPGALQSAVVATIPVIGRDHPDYIPLRIAVMALGGYFGSRLMLNIREDKGYTYGISAVLMGQPEGGYVRIAAECDNRYVDDLIAEVVSEVRGMSERLLSDAELDHIRRHYLTTLADQLDSPLTMMDVYISQQLVGTPEGYFAMQQAAVEGLTPQLVAEVCRRHLRFELMSVAVAGNRQ